MIFIIRYKRKNREPWLLEINGGFKQWIDRHRSYGFDVEVIPTPEGTVLEVDTHGLGGWERDSAHTEV